MKKQDINGYILNPIQIEKGFEINIFKEGIFVDTAKVEGNQRDLDEFMIILESAVLEGFFDQLFVENRLVLAQLANDEQKGAI